MTFVPPSWISGLLTYVFVYGLLIALSIGLILTALLKDVNVKLLAIGIISCILIIPCGSYIIHEMMEVPSVQEDVITVQEWQPKPNIHTNRNGMMVINSADDLLLVTTDGKGYLNEENFWFQKFNTRDIFNDLKVNGTYKIKYYGWREGFNSGFPNILSIEEVVNESNVTNNDYNKYFGNQVIVN